MDNIENLLKPLALGMFIVKNNYITYEEYLERLVDYNLLIIEYSLKLGNNSFKQSIMYYMKFITDKNVKVSNKYEYLSKALNMTLNKKEKGYY